MEQNFESRFSIGEAVYLYIEDYKIPAVVRGVGFDIKSEGKVSYDLEVKLSSSYDYLPSLIKEVDSCLVDI